VEIGDDGLEGVGFGECYRAWNKILWVYEGNIKIRKFADDLLLVLFYTIAGRVWSHYLTGLG
jgi:hypothetical protein